MMYTEKSVDSILQNLILPMGCEFETGLQDSRLKSKLHLGGT